MQISPRSSSTGFASSTASSASKVDETNLTAPTGTSAAAGASAPAPVARRGGVNWDQPLQGDVSGAQQAIDFLEQSAAQLRALKMDLSAKLTNRQAREGQVEARVRQFSDTWRGRQEASGGTLDSQLAYSTSETKQRFTVRGMNMNNLRNGPRETLTISVGGGVQGLRSVALESGLSDAEIVQRFDQALAPVNIRVSANDKGELEFIAPESSWAAVRDTLSMQGGGIRFPGGQLSRVRADAQPGLITPDGWQTSDVDGLRETLHQVVQALAHVEAALAKVNLALSEAVSRAAMVQPQISPARMDQAAQNFVTTTNDPGYSSLLALSSALVGINRERVLSLLGLR